MRLLVFLLGSPSLLLRVRFRQLQLIILLKNSFVHQLMLILLLALVSLETVLCQFQVMLCLLLVRAELRQNLIVLLNARRMPLRRVLGPCLIPKVATIGRLVLPLLKLLLPLKISCDGVIL